MLVASPPKKRRTPKPEQKPLETSSPAPAPALEPAVEQPPEKKKTRVECPKCGCHHAPCVAVRPLGKDRWQREHHCRNCASRILYTVKQKFDMVLPPSPWSVRSAIGNVAKLVKKLVHLDPE